jgi:hypothetical protein
MAPPSFPALPGQGWSVHKKPVFATNVALHTSGREVRAGMYRNPLWEFELTFDGLASDLGSYPGLGGESLQALMGLYLQSGGQFGTFLYTDPTDNAALSQGIGVGDGVTAAFTFQRALGGFLEPVDWVTAVSGIAVNGVAQPSGWSLTAPNILSFAVAPASGAVIAASFTFAFVCRFTDDSADFEQFMQNLWTVKSLKFRSVRQ